MAAGGAVTAGGVSCAVTGGAVTVGGVAGVVVCAPSVTSIAMVSAMVIIKRFIVTLYLILSSIVYQRPYVLQQRIPLPSYGNNSKSYF